MGEKGGYYVLGIGLSIAILIGLVIMFYAYKTAPELVYENKTVAVYSKPQEVAITLSELLGIVIVFTLLMLLAMGIGYVMIED